MKLGTLTIITFKLFVALVITSVSLPETALSNEKSLRERLAARLEQSQDRERTRFGSRPETTETTFESPDAQDGSDDDTTTRRT